MVIKAILAGLLCGILGLFVTGYAAASVLTRALGPRDGGPAMSGFFMIGPVGGIAGILLGVGLALRFGGGSAGWGQGLMIAAGGVLVIAGILVSMSLPDKGPSYSYVIEFQLEFPAVALAGVDIPGPNAMWGAAGADMDDKPISQFFEKNCTGDVCLLKGSVAALGPMNNFRIAAAIASKTYRYTLDIPLVAEARDWSAWRDGDGARVRWRIVTR